MTDRNVGPYNTASSLSSGLLSRVKAGDQDAWDRLVDLYGRLVYWWCRQKGVDEQGASDIGQEVFLAAYRYKDRFRRQDAGDTFRGWLRTITNSKIADYYRSRMTQPNAVGGSSATQLLQQAAANWEEEDTEDSILQETRILYTAILDFIRNEFSDTDWKAFSKVVMEGQSPSDIADELGISRNQVYLAKSRILRRIREQFGNDLD